MPVLAARVAPRDIPASARGARLRETWGRLLEWRGCGRHLGVCARSLDPRRHDSKRGDATLLDTRSNAPGQNLQLDVVAFESPLDTARSSKKRPAAEPASSLHHKKRREEDTLQTRFEARQTFPLPNLLQRSVQEVTFAAHLLDVTGELTVAALAHCLCRGDALGQVDMVFDQLGCACEWDPLWCHSAERVEGDVRKTERMLRECSDLQVVRLRIGAPPLGLLASSPRYIEITVPADTSIPKAAQAFGKRISCPEPFASRLRQAHGRKRPRAVQVVNDLFCLCDAAYKKAFASMVKSVGHNNALNMVQNVHGVWTSIGIIAKALALLRTEFGMTAQDLVTFVGDGVASAMVGDNADVFWAGLEKLRAQGMTTKHLVTFVGDGVASAIVGDNADVFWAGLKKMRPGHEHHDAGSSMDFRLQGKALIERGTGEPST